MLRKSMLAATLAALFSGGAWAAVSADEASLEVVHQLGVGDVIESITIQNLSQ